MGLGSSADSVLEEIEIEGKSFCFLDEGMGYREPPVSVAVRLHSWWVGEYSVCCSAQPLEPYLGVLLPQKMFWDRVMKFSAAVNLGLRLR